MEKQISVLSMKTHQCKNCQGSFPISQIFNCVQCSVMICGSCGLRKHRTHTLNDLLVEEQIKTMMEETRNFFSSEHDYYQNEFKSQCETELRRMFSGISSLQLEIANKLSQMTENDLERAKSEVKRLKGLYGEMRLFYGKYEAQNKMHWDYLQVI
ncbi:unnamed protein product, partial [Mesorhabditis belari]|uniref:Uncharacterized protein n=1 Tax=Mesorhabditis belari TaxID=2138241 RepID=A0AAF3EPJ1_9BILA